VTVGSVFRNLTCMLIRVQRGNLKPSDNVMWKFVPFAQPWHRVEGID